MAEQKLANPAAIGLAGFALTTMILQFHNLGWCGVGPIVACGLIYGGLAQMIAGFLEQKTGNTFGFSAFTSYGAFWIALGVIFLLNHFNIYKASTTDVGCFMLVWTFYTAIMFVASMRTNSALAWTFATLLVGFILLVLAHFGFPAMTKVAAWDLIVCASLAWYVMAHVILADFGVNVPVGKAWIS
ncbi:MAG: acetate uptake transporter [Desulfobacterales bacterium]|nr:acetate uptake transporter [Desulfobacterales bacterium]MDD4071338.1 acetate uptake transporter [Desulfobacterales bacterium]MDD4392978.1 acetate uptake transporter [Desulfobacterales bacterium]